MTMRFPATATKIRMPKMTLQMVLCHQASRCTSGSPAPPSDTSTPAHVADDPLPDRSLSFQPDASSNVESFMMPPRT